MQRWVGLHRAHRKLLSLLQILLTLLKSSEVALISFHVLFRSWIQMQKNSSKDLSWVKNIGWKSLQVSLAGGKKGGSVRREMKGYRHMLQREMMRGIFGSSHSGKKGILKRQPKGSHRETSQFKVRWSDLPLGAYFDRRK